MLDQLFSFYVLNDLLANGVASLITVKASTENSCKYRPNTRTHPPSTKSPDCYLFTQKTHNEHLMSPKSIQEVYTKRSRNPLSIPDNLLLYVCPAFLHRNLRAGSGTVLEICHPGLPEVPNVWRWKFKSGYGIKRGFISVDKVRNR